MIITKHQLRKMILEASGDKWFSCGGVVFDDTFSKVLLCLPSGSGRNSWTLPKGRMDPGETQAQTALREVEEETGWICEIIANIPGSFEGSYSINKYFIMRGISPTGNKDYEMAAVDWFSIEEAKKTLSLKRKERDFLVLNAAINNLPSKYTR